MAIPSSYKEFDVWVNESKSALNLRNFSNPLRHKWSVERCLLFHYQSPEEFFAGECTGYCSQENGSVRVDLWELGEHLTVERAIALVEAQYTKRTAYLTEIVEKQQNQA
jgi:hypothetical protein